MVAIKGCELPRPAPGSRIVRDERGKSNRETRRRSKSAEIQSGESAKSPCLMDLSAPSGTGSVHARSIPPASRRGHHPSSRRNPDSISVRSRRADRQQSKPIAKMSRRAQRRAMAFRDKFARDLSIMVREKNDRRLFRIRATAGCGESAVIPDRPPGAERRHAPSHPSPVRANSAKTPPRKYDNFSIQTGGWRT